MLLHHLQEVPLLCLALWLLHLPLLQLHAAVFCRQTPAPVGDPVKPPDTVSQNMVAFQIASVRVVHAVYCYQLCTERISKKRTDFARGAGEGE